MVRKLILSLILSSILLIGGLAGYVNRPNRTLTDQEIRSNVVQLVNPSKGTCSGELVKLSKDRVVILTASHCRVLEQSGYIEAHLDDGTISQAKIIAEDPTSDLMALEAPQDVHHGLEIASSEQLQQHVRSFTHGLGMATYKTEGVLIQYQTIEAPLYQIDSHEAEDKCSGMPKLHVISVPTFYGELKLCALVTRDVISTAMIVPGSSGGAIVDDSGKLLNVVSAGNGTFGCFVTLSDIKSFLSKL